MRCRPFVVRKEEPHVMFYHHVWEYIIEGVQGTRHLFTASFDVGFCPPATSHHFCGRRDAPLDETDDPGVLYPVACRAELVTRLLAIVRTGVWRSVLDRDLCSPAKPKIDWSLAVVPRHAICRREPSTYECEIDLVLHLSLRVNAFCHGGDCWRHQIFLVELGAEGTDSLNQSPRPGA